MQKEQNTLLWGSRFSKELNEDVNDFNSSLPFDKVLYKYDIKGSIAHATMLFHQGIISDSDKDEIMGGLNEILAEIESGKLQFDYNFEDIHSFIEANLVKKIGAIGKKVHTSRSRNDQVALDIRLYLKDEIKEIQKLILNLIKTLMDFSNNHLETIMPGYTHLQRAQAVTLAHYLGAYIEMFKRDKERLDDTYKRVNVLPLGAGALAGSPYNIKRNLVAEHLGFDSICLNSMDAVSDRDFIIETLSDLAMIMTHLSRISEEIIMWSSFEFKFVDLDDSYSTGSSIMPQKKNPDILELIRGKTGRVYGSLISILTTMKSLPLAYNKDMQEDKEPLFDGIKTVKNCLKILPNVLKTMKVNKEKMLQAAKEGFLNATDVADYLTKKGLPFRDSHNVAGKLVSYCINSKKTLDELSMDEFKKESNLFEDDIYGAIDIKNSVISKKEIGGPNPETVKHVLELNKIWLSDNEI